MGCNCGKAKNQVTTYQFTSPDGNVKVYNTQLEARAAQIRAKGGTLKAVTSTR